jgi:signal transduction histidine kinase
MMIDDNIPEKMLLDQSRFINILVNLVSNAIKFTNQGSVSIIANWLPDSSTALTDQESLLNETFDEIN